MPGSYAVATHSLRAGDVFAAPAAASSTFAQPSQQAAFNTLTDVELSSRDHEMLRDLEERLDRQRREYQAVQQSLAIVQAQLREAEESRRTDPALYGLSTLIVMLIGTIAVLLWRLSRAHDQLRWIDEAQDLTQHLSPDLAPTPHGGMASFEDATMPSRRVLTQFQLAPMSGSDPAVPTTAPAALRPRRELSAAELVDLEQEADFFIALGEEDAAIDFLMGLVRSSGGTTPMPYLKLLGIYKRRGECDPYERIRERFNLRFNAHAPTWEQFGQQGRTLECHEMVFERIVAAWPTPPQAIDLLQDLLYNRDASKEPFELPAYEELLFLHAVIRDVLEHMTSAESVDLLLPLGTEGEASAILHQVARQPHLSMSSVDLALDDLPLRKR